MNPNLVKIAQKGTCAALAALVGTKWLDPGDYCISKRKKKLFLLRRFYMFDSRLITDHFSHLFSPRVCAFQSESDNPILIFSVTVMKRRACAVVLLDPQSPHICYIIFLYHIVCHCNLYKIFCWSFLCMQHLLHVLCVSSWGFPCHKFTWGVFFSLNKTKVWSFLDIVTPRDYWLNGTEMAKSKTTKSYINVFHIAGFRKTYITKMCFDPEQIH